MRTEPGPPLTVDASVPDNRQPLATITAAVRDRTTAVPAAADRSEVVPDRPDGQPSADDGGPEVTALVPAARTAARTLTVEGTPMSRKALARQLRADGHQLSNATASALVRVLRAETTSPAPNLSPGEAA
ncbi:MULTISPECIES: hypothetical protein [unclassified Micromonospora]|uniref:hypothetical protein n=1 Tax=unclassified Micromonospora TaxID=2617518 RepID=UPI0033A43846